MFVFLQYILLIFTFTGINKWPSRIAPTEDNSSNITTHLNEQNDGVPSTMAPFRTSDVRFELEPRDFSGTQWLFCMLKIYGLNLIVY